MLRSTLFLLGGLLAGWAVAAWWMPGPEAVSEPAATAAASAPRADRDGRVAALEAALARERAQRLELAAEVDALEDSVARLEGARATDYSGSDDGESRDGSRDSASPDVDEPFALRARELDMSPEQRRVARLVEAGFAPDRAEWITRRESELRMNALEAQYEARRTGEPLEPAVVDEAATLRAELGDADYERYLEATGRSTSVGVRNVLAGSPAEQAGLRRGDRLVSYNGQRIYDVGDLNRLTVEGTPGESVTVDVVRDGQTIQVVIPRGPIGITGGGRFGRRGR